MRGPSGKETKPSFGAIADEYPLLRARHHLLPEVHPQILRQLDRQIEEGSRNRKTRTYLAAVLTVIGFFAIIPALAYGVLGLALRWQGAVSHAMSQRLFLDGHPALKILSLVLPTMVVMYMFVLPTRTGQTVMSRITPLWRRRMSERLFEVDRGCRRFIAIGAGLTYLALAPVLVDAYSYGAQWRPSVGAAGVIWLMMPIALPGALVLFLSVAAVSGYIAGMSRADDVTTGRIVAKIARSLKELDEVDEADFVDLGVKDDVAGNILSLSSMLKRLYSADSGATPASRWAAKVMRKVADRVMTLTTKVYFPNAGALDELRSALCEYLGAFAAGDYAALLVQGDMENPLEDPGDTRRPWYRTALLVMSVAAYAGLPLAVAAITLTDLKLTVPAWVQTPLTALYGAWLVAGILVLGRHLSPDEKSTMKEIVNTVLFRK